MADNVKRKCLKCGLSPNADDPSIQLHRFPRPGSTNMRKCEMWAKYCFPDKLWSSVDFQRKLYSEHRMLCNKHFKDSEFIDIEEKKLSKHAVPDMVDFDEEIDLQPMKKLWEDNIQISKNQDLSALDCTKESVPEPIEVLMDITNKNYKKTMLEVCIDSLESAINAIHGGADELEVCSSLTEGGLTPSAGLVKQIMEMVNNIAAGKPIRKSCHDCGCDKLTERPKVNVMIRCRTGSDFHYSVEEMDTMLSDVDVFKAYGVDRFVFGALTETQHIDVENCTILLLHADPVPVTFHRAFDVCIDPLLSIKKVAELGFDRLLTSGQKATANDAEAIELIKAIIASVGDKVAIMPGAGINLDNVKTFIDIGCRIVHSSCKRIRYLPQIKNGLSMGTSDSEHVFVTDENIVEKMKEISNQKIKLDHSIVLRKYEMV